MAEKLTLTLSVDKDGLVNIDSLRGKLASVDRQAKATSKGLSTMGTSLKAAVIVTGVNQLLGALHKVGRMASWVGKQMEEGIKANRIASAFDTLAVSSGKTGNALRGLLQEATGYEMTLTDLEKTSTKVALATGNLADSVTVLAYAHKIAASTGKETAQVAETLAQALASGRTKSLRQYGLMISQSAEYSKAAKKAGVDVSWLTEQEQKRAINTAALARMEQRLASMADITSSAYLKQKTAILDAQSSMQQWMAGGAPQEVLGTGFEGVFNASSAKESLDVYVRGLDDLTAKEAASAAATKARQDAETSNWGIAAGETDRAYIAMDGLIAQEKKLGKAAEDANRAADMAAMSIADASEETTAALEKAVSFASKVNWGNVFALGMGGIDSLISNASRRWQSASQELLAFEVARDRLASKPNLSEDETAALGQLNDAISETIMGMEGLDRSMEAVQGVKQILRTSTVDYVAVLREQIRATIEAKGPMASELASLEQKLKFTEQLYSRELKLLGLHRQTTKGSSFAELVGISPRDSAAVADMEVRFERLSSSVEALTATAGSEDFETFQGRLATIREQSDLLRVSMDDSGVSAENAKRYFNGLGQELQWVEERARAAGKSLTDEAFDEFKRAMDEMGAPGWDPKKEDQKRKPGRAARAKPQDITEEELRLRLKLTQDNLEPIQIAEYEHDLAVYNAKRANVGKTRELQADLAEVEKRYAGQLREIGKARADEIVKQGKKEREALREYLAGQKTKAETYRREAEDHAILTGELTQYEAERRKIISMDLSDPWDERLQRIRMETLAYKERVATLQETSEAIVGIGNAFSQAVSDASQFGEVDKNVIRMASSVRGLASGVGQVVGANGEIGKMGSGFVAVSAALASVVAAQGSSAKESAAIMAGFSTATALILGAMAFVYPALAPAALEAAGAAVAYGVIAGTSGGAAGSHRASVAGSSLGTSIGQSNQSSNASYTFVFNEGFALSTQEGIANKIVDSLDTIRFSGRKIAPELVRSFG